MKILSRNRMLFVPVFMGLLAVVTAGACKNSDEPILSYLTNKRMIVILKGTYATDNPLTMAEINGNVLFTDSDDTLDLSGIPTYSQLPIYIDIGELRLSTKNFLDPLWGIDSAKDADKFWDVLSPNRQVYCSQPYAVSFDNDACFQTGGLINYIEFMNGRGAVYPATDVGAGTYLHAGIFLRSLTVGYSKIGGALQIAKFDNNDVLGVNIQPALNYDPGVDAATKDALPPQTFPLHHMVTWGQQMSMIVDHATTTLVVEMRFNLKENLMVHSFVNTLAQVHTLVGVSDWKRAHANQTDMGGSIFTRARMFHPDVTSDLYITGGTFNVQHYYAVYGGNECGDLFGGISCDKNDWLPMAATPVRNGTNVIKNLMPGMYELQCRKDTVRDGYPEQVIRTTTFVIARPGLATGVALTCP